MSFLRYYDEAVVDYFKTLEIEDGEEKRSPQVLFAVPSRQGVKLNVNEDKVPIMPFISVIRSGISPNTQTPIVKGHVHRPRIFSLDSSKKHYVGTELMPYNLNYQVDIFSLIQDMYYSIIEEIIFKMYKKHYVRTQFETDGHVITNNGYITNISYNDSTSYSQIASNLNRIFHGVVTFTLEANIVSTDFKTHSVLEEVVDQYNDEELVKTIEETAE